MPVHIAHSRTKWGVNQACQAVRMLSGKMTFYRQAKDFAVFYSSNMALAETQAGVIGKFFSRMRTNAPANPPETLTFGNQTEPVSPDTEGDIRTGGVDSSFPPEPQELKIRIIGSRDRRTGEILPCHQEVHGTYIELLPLEPGQTITIE